MNVCHISINYVTLVRMCVTLLQVLPAITLMSRNAAAACWVLMSYIALCHILHCVVWQIYCWLRLSLKVWILSVIHLLLCQLLFISCRSIFFWYPIMHQLSSLKVDVIGYSAKLICVGRQRFWVVLLQYYAILFVIL